MGNYIFGNRRKASYAGNNDTRYAREQYSTKPVQQSLDYHIQNYKEQMQCKEREIIKLITAKLALTDNLIKSKSAKEQGRRSSRLVGFQAHAAFNNNLGDADADAHDEELDSMIASIERELIYLQDYRIRLIELLVYLLNVAARKKGKKAKKKKLLSKCVLMTCASFYDTDFRNFPVKKNHFNLN